MENATTTLQQRSDEFTTKATMDVFRSLRNNVRFDRPTVWLTKDTGICPSTLRSMYCRYKKEGKITDSLQIISQDDPEGAIIIRKNKK